MDNDDEKGVDSSEEERDPGLRAVEIYSSDSEMENQREKQSNFRERKKSQKHVGRCKGGLSRYDK